MRRLVSILTIGFSLFAERVSAQTESLKGFVGQRTKDIGAKALLSGGDNLTPFDIIGSILFILLGAVGVVFVIITIHGGFLWMTAGGNEDQVGKARAKITNGAIGIVIIFAAYLLTSYLMAQICNTAIFGVSCNT